ncbi:MAG: hypothetical protein M1546_21925 [Chloroflexi bacterium]|nr:hypothetical protein [Chloroflexota bacterium]
MTSLPRDSTERHKLALLSDLHGQLLSYRNAERGHNTADANSDLIVSEELCAIYPELPCQAAPGKTLAETVTEEWLEPRIRQTINNLDPRKIKTSTQAHKLQAVLAYYYTYIKEHLSAGQIVDSKMQDAQSICDTWCYITGNKRFAVNKLMEDLLTVRSPRTMQRYVAQGMAITFSISFGSARSGKKIKTLPKEGQVHNEFANGATVPTLDRPSPHRLSRSNIIRSLDVLALSTLDAESLDHFLSSIGDVHKVVTSIAMFIALAQFAMKVPEAAYSQSRLFGSFAYDLSQYEPDSVEDRLDIVELREQLRSHPIVKHVLAEKHQQRLQSTRTGELQIAQQLCRALTRLNHSAHVNVHASIAQLCAIVKDRLEDEEFTGLVTRTFDQLPQTNQVALVSKLLDDCRPYSFNFVASLAARSSGSFVRSRAHYLAHTSRECWDHSTHAHDRLAQIIEHVESGNAVSPETRNEMLFLESYVKAAGVSIDLQK